VRPPFEEPGRDPRLTTEHYFALVREGVLEEHDRVELLEGVVVAMAPSGPDHASVTGMLADALRHAIGSRATVREEKPLVLGPHSVPEPDVALVAGTHADHHHQHPTTALLVVEVSDSSLPQDRLTKGRIYAAAGIPEYWIVNLRDACVEVHRDPDPDRRVYRTRHVTGRDGSLTVLAFPDVRIAVGGVLGPRQD
jgi:Uma2 family endonuclease